MNKVIVGAQWGDEGKAKITDILAADADLIIRYQGGCNAGHTVVTGGKTFKFHLIPSGILYPGKTCFIGAGTVILPESFETEVNGLIAQGIDVSGLKVSPLASVTMPYHVAADDPEGKIGSTRKGIGPTYTDKYARKGVKIQDLFDDEQYKQYADIFASYVCWDWQEMLRSYKKSRILFEGAQGVMLDVDYGTYPFVTSSNPIGGGAAVGSGYGPTMIDEVIGVAKAYVTRVGEGPFITELNNEMGEKIREIGAEFGTTTGRPRRCGWFDAVTMRYAVLVGGLTQLTITKTDVFDSFDEIKICTAYKDTRNNEICTSYPTNVRSHKYMEPVYETHKGWGQDLTGVRRYKDLPENAKKYLARLEELLEVPISIISVGPGREQTIFIQSHAV